MFIAWFHDFTNLLIYGNNFVLTMLSVVSKENTDLDSEQEEFLELNMWLITCLWLQKRNHEFTNLQIHEFKVLHKDQTAFKNPF